MAVAGRSYANVPVISRGSLEDPDDFNPKVPALVVTSQPAVAQTVTPRNTIARNTLQDPPVLTTAPPVVVAAVTDRRWFTAGIATVVTALQPPAVTPGPVVVTSQPPWPKTVQALTVRSALADPPVLTTASPLIVAAAADRRWFAAVPARIVAGASAASSPSRSGLLMAWIV